MKLLFCLFFILAMTSFTLAQTNGYQIVPSSEYGSSAILKLLLAGSDHIINIETSKIPREQYYAAAINSLERRVNGNVTSYRFNIRVINADESIIIRMNFTVQAGPGPKDVDVQSYRFVINKPDRPSDDKYQPIDPSQYTDENIQRLLVLASDHIINVETAKIPRDTYAISVINSISSAVYSGSTFYKFDILVTNPDNTSRISMDIIVKDRPTGDDNVVAYSFVITRSTRPNDNSYQPVDPSSWTSTLIRNLAQAGADYIVRVETQKIPRDNYRVSEISSVSKSNYRNADFYKFAIRVLNGNGRTRIRMNFLIKDTLDGRPPSVLSYSFVINRS